MISPQFARTQNLRCNIDPSADSGVVTGSAREHSAKRSVLFCPEILFGEEYYRV
jgi:hypothetical protein